MKRSFTITIDLPEDEIARQSRIVKAFEGIREISLQTLCGGCVVGKSGSASVKVEAASTFRDAKFAPKLEQVDDRLVLVERFEGPALVGGSAWKLLVPDDIRFRFSSSSGGLEVQGLKAEIEASISSGRVSISDLKGSLRISTSSGRIEAKNISGQMALSSSSGDVLLADCSGSISAKSSSGRTAARAIVITAPSSFFASSGDAEVSLGQSPNHDLQISSSSGDAVLNFNGNPIRGLIRMTSKGRIEAPFAFDKEETFSKWGQKYVTKTATRGAAAPEVKIASASGSAVLREH